MTAIFISYRRSDAAPHAGRLYDRLSARFGDAAVFMDVDDIEPGADFPRVIGDNVARSDVLLVVIGPGWSDVRDAEGRRRLDDPADFVRRELQSAIGLGKRVVPLLVGGATMPAAADLPGELAALPRYNALELSDARFDADFARLLQVLDPGHGHGPTPASGPRAPGVRRWAIGTLMAAAVLAAAAYGLLPQLRRGEGAASAPALDGNWSARVTYGWGVTHDEKFVFTTRDGELLGAAGFLGVARPIIAGRVNGSDIAFSTHTQEMVGRDTRNLVHNYRGTLAGDGIRFVLLTEGGSTGGPVEFTASRVQ